MSASARLFIDHARSETGLDNFGDDSFREGLEILLASIDREARFNAVGEASFNAQINGFLTQRLHVEDWYRRHPEIDAQEIVAPLIGLGLPRTGSTAFSHMLGEDPAARSLRNWEAMSPCPPPDAETQADDPRIAMAQAAMDRRDVLFPRMKQMLPSTATSPTECQTFMGQDFKSQLFQAFAHIPTYMEWLNHKADLVPTYRYVKRVLKLLQWRCPPYRWRLKNPSHSLFIGALHEVFPDARYWMTHRDIAQVAPSVADLYFELSTAYSDHVDPKWLGAVTTEFCELGMQRMIAFRDAGHDHRFFDVHFADFQADPFSVFERLYAFLGEDFTDETRTRMAQWRQDRPRSDYRHDTTDFGLDTARLQARFQFYSNRFGRGKG